MKALVTLQSLSASEKNLLKTKQIVGEATSDEWLSLFTKLRNFDKEGDKTRRNGGWMIAGGIIISFISVFLIAFGIGLVTLPIGLLITIVGLTIYLYMRSFDISGEIFTDRLLPIVKILREEMRSGEKIKMNLDLRGFNLPEKFVRKEDSYADPVYTSMTHSYYKDPWLSGEAMLADGTKLNWNVIDFVRSTYKTKRNARGKHKAKTKNKYRSRVDFRAGMNQKRYLLPPNLKQKTPTEKIITKKTDDYTWMRITKTMKYAETSGFSPKDFIDLTATVYSRATPAK